MYIPRPVIITTQLSALFAFTADGVFPLRLKAHSGVVASRDELMVLFNNDFVSTYLQRSVDDKNDELLYD